MKQFFCLLFLFVFVSGLSFAQNEPVVDENAPFAVNPNPTVYVPETPLEEVFGLNQNVFGPSGLRGRGNIYLCTTPRKLIEHRLYLNPTAAANMWFLVYEGAALNGVYNLVHSINVPNQGPGEGWYSSGTIDFDFQAGMYYAIYPQWDVNANYYTENPVAPPYPIPASFGELVTGVGWDWAPIYGDPPPATQTVTVAATVPVAYYQTIVTDDIGGSGSGFPEVLYYTFDEAGSNTTQNFAVPGRGSAFADVLGGLTMGPTGQFDNAVIGSGGSSSTDYVGTGWITDIGTSDWTISLWLNNLPAGTALNYLFGDNTAGSWRCFYSGAAGEYGVLFRLTGPGGTDITVPAVGPGPSVLTFVYDSSVPTVYAYINGVLAVTQPQAAALNIVGTAEFKVAGYSTSAGFPIGSLMDEFRFYDRALDAAEVAATWNISIVPVELTSFTASVNGNNVKLLWETASEINNSGFNVERKSANSEYSTVGFVPGFGTTTEPKSYAFSDNNVRTGVYTYRLKQIDYDGTFEYSPEIQVEVVAPASYSLEQNYPNPFNPSTNISFSLAVNSKVSLKIFDLLGQEVVSLVNEDLTAGVHNYDFNATGINSGVYFYRIEANGIDGTNFTNSKKMILLK